jgi:hypothetical protein
VGVGQASHHGGLHVCEGADLTSLRFVDVVSASHCGCELDK